jgi:hypothetical protein
LAAWLHTAAVCFSVSVLEVKADLSPASFTPPLMTHSGLEESIAVAHTLLDQGPIATDMLRPY